ncbi:MAG: DegT/DnrJ/EryC1/StrS family aminotransferase [Candidatus Omnitrophota bacterium]|jgi:dTDP-4-amino-4,6-dideoxygalactose transaminase|nr:MAG: DegT/DnrJ/EryC1/StrS family aminotransferase [Candidatus Omnitrophota bacterium]
MQIPFNRPTLPPWELIKEAFHSFYDTGHITNGPLVRQLELEAKDILRERDAIAVSCCTSGLILALKYLGLRGKVALPSYTFFASAHSLVWNNLEPVFVDVEEDTWNLSVGRLEEALGEEEDITAIMPVHVFGNPCDVRALERVARDNGLSLLYDSAHAMGAKVGEERVGSFGDAEVFSLSPTKIVVAGEGGIITTADRVLAEMLRAGRDYGNTGDYNPSLVGLNARMSEFHAALAIGSFRLLELNVQLRNTIAERYKAGLSGLPGLVFQVVKEGNRSTYKDFTMLIDASVFGMNRDVLAWYLAYNGIDTRKYYYPPVHRTAIYWDKWGNKYDKDLPITNMLSKNVLSLPIWSHMDERIVELVVERINEAHCKADEVTSEYLKEKRDNPI